MIHAFLAVYFFILGFLTIFGAHRYLLTYLYYRHKKQLPENIPGFSELKEIPVVTVQLPIYNEKYVVERLVHQVCLLDYPRDRLEIQLLDDSTDETQKIAEAVVMRLQKQGFPILHLHRKNRNGFKAGALQEGLQVAKGRFIAVFDADFMPQPDFLKKMIPYFYGARRYGMIQARWGHLNQDYSLMTQAQSVLLDGHFVVEHTARNRSGRFFNFNGTAGIWDRECIEDAGGWEFDTLTEDLDLSYRAQIKGWKFLYLPDVVVPAELPVDMNGFKAQQHRWAKGSIQTAKKLWWKILKSPLPWKIKAESFLHLFNNLAFLFMIMLALIIPLSVWVRHQWDWSFSLWIDLPVFFLATLSIGFFYCCSLREIYSDWKSRLWLLPLNLAVGIGMAANNSKAVLEALLNRKSEFTRTAKYAIAKKTDSWQNKKYKSPAGLLAVVELCLGLYYTGALIYAISAGLWVSLYYLILFQVGFLYVGLLSLMQGRPSLGLTPSLEATSSLSLE